VWDHLWSAGEDDALDCSSGSASSRTAYKWDYSEVHKLWGRVFIRHTWAAD
jgi:hypothetical protein